MGYADDHQFYESYSVQPEIEKRVVRDMELKLDEVRDWMTSNRLKMNDSKTEAIIFGQKAELKSSNCKSIKVGDADIEIAEMVNYLGAPYDSDMSMRTMISEKCRKMNMNIHNIRRIRKYIDNDTCKTMVHALVISHLDYANVLLYGLPDTEIGKLDALQTMAAKLILNKGRRDSITFFLIFSYKIEVICYKWVS